MQAGQAPLLLAFSAAASAWASAVSISSSLSSSCSSSRLTRSEEAPKDCLLRRAIWTFSFSASSVFNRRPALAASRSTVRSWTSRLSSSISLSSSVMLGMAAKLTASRLRRHHPASCGVKVLRGARHSRPSSSIESCAGVSVTAPSLVTGQVNRPFSSRLANRQKPWPSQ